MQSLPYSNSLKFLPTPITCEPQKFQKKSQLPSFSHTICDPTIHVCVSLSLSLTCIVSLGNTKSKFLFVVAQELHNLLYIQGVDQQHSKSSFCSHTNQPPGEKAIVGTRKSPCWLFFLTLGRAGFTKWNLPPNRLEGVSIFHWAFHEVIIIISSGVPSLCSHFIGQFVDTSLGNFIGWPAKHYVM